MCILKQEQDGTVKGRRSQFLVEEWNIMYNHILF